MLFDIPPDNIEYMLGDIFLLNDPTSTWSDFWKPLPGKFTDWSDKKNVLKIPDITVWFTNEIVLNKKGYEDLANSLNNYGEFLPITVEGKPYWVLHVTKFVTEDAINTLHSTRIIDEAECITVEDLAFNEQAISDLFIFRTEFTGYKNIYCTEKFKTLIETAGLRGLLFSTDLAGVNEPQ